MDRSLHCRGSIESSNNTGERDFDPIAKILDLLTYIGLRNLSQAGQVPTDQLSTLIFSGALHRFGRIDKVGE
jgi:hypothetical protein